MIFGRKQTILYPQCSELNIMGHRYVSVLGLRCFQSQTKRFNPRIYGVQACCGLYLSAVAWMLKHNVSASMPQSSRSGQSLQHVCV